MNKYIIGAFSKGKLAQPYFDSLALLGEEVKPIIVQYLNDTKFDRVKVPSNVKLIKYKKRYPGNTGKHKDFREIISPLLEANSWCILTDIHDLSFQGPLPEFPEDADILVANEGKTFGEVGYWQGIFPPDIWNKQMYNVGCTAMKTEVLLAFWEYLYENWMKFFTWYKSTSQITFGNREVFPFQMPIFHEKVRTELAIMYNAHYDTLCYNRFIGDYKTQEVDGLFACYAFQVEQGGITCKEGKLYREDKLVSIAHFNGDSKKFMKGGKV